MSATGDRVAVEIACQIPTAFEQISGGMPEAIAVQSADRLLTYDELDQRANQVAWSLLALGVKRGDVVALVAERGAETVAAALGVMKVGAAYSPLDADAPELRLSAQIENLRAAAVILPHALVGRLDDCPVPVITHDSAWRSFAAQPSERPAVELAAEDLFAVICTSGSTGRPKAVALEHRSILNLLRSTSELSPHAGERALQVCAPQFDVGAYEIWATLLAGGRLVCHPPGRPEPREVCATIAENGVTWASMVTGLFHQLVEYGPEALAEMRMILVGGEQLLPRYVRRFRQQCPEVRLTNIYGPTETTVFFCAHGVSAEDETAQRVPVGAPLAGARVAIRDERGSSVPRGSSGELYVAGPGIARGYLHQPGLTAERFRSGRLTGERWYRTGDLARELAGGEIELLGRLDDQIKLRGYRVEPGEVEVVLASHPGVRHAAVVARAEGSGTRRLVAYFVPDDSSADESSLRIFLAARLPEYMVPSAFVQLDDLPLNARGKLDRRALPEPEVLKRDSGGATPNSLAFEIAEIFAELLDVPAVDPHDDVLALGADSLIAVQALARLRDRHQIELPVAAVFKSRTASELAARAGTAIAGEPLPPLRPVPWQPNELVSATAGQAKALMVAELAEDNLPYQSQAAHRILGTLDVAALERALTELVRRHEMLRTTFERHDGVWMQRVHAPFAVRLAISDLSIEPDPESALGAHTARVFQTRLDPARLPLARWSLARLDDHDHALLVLEHHVVHDGVSTAEFLDQLATLYAAELAAGPRPPREPPVQFRDFARWQRDLAASSRGMAALEHWRTRLRGAPAELSLPLDRPRGARQTYRGDSLRLTLDPAFVDALQRRARALGATPFTVMLAAFCLLLGRYSGEEDVVVGTGLANRRTLESEQLIGMIVNTAALRVSLGEGGTVREFVGRVGDAVLDAQAHQDVPFEQVVEHIAPVRSANVSPLYQALFSFHDAAVRTLALPGALLVPRDAIANGSAKSDLNVVVIYRRGGSPPGVDAEAYGRIAEDGVTIVWEYNSDLFERATAERMVRHYRLVLEQLVTEDAERTIRRIQLADRRERATLLELAAAGGRYERDKTVPELFTERAAERPHDIAISDGERTLSYWQLERLSNRLANRLRELGAERGSRVAVCMDRSLDLIVALLAVAKAGAAYVPLDPADPPPRLHAQIASIGARLAVINARYRDVLPGSPVRHLCLDDDQDLYRLPDTPPPGDRQPSDPLYVMFTSGSTGTPKGVEVTHRAVVRLVRGADYVRLGPEETLLALAQTSFDASTFEVWGALLNGGRLAVAPPGPLSTGELADLIDRERVTTLWLTAGLFHRVVDDRPALLASLRQLLAGGDVLSPDHVQRALDAMTPGSVLVNGYGPTEATTFTCAHRMQPGDAIGTSVPIGRPVPGTRVYVLDAVGEPVPVGVPGELWIGGDGVALGYVGDPDLTASRFRPDPFAAEPGARMYRSGDRARWRNDGMLEFLGRADRQLKIRGFRVEPGEVETVLRRHPGVADACVVPDVQGGAARALIAYVVPRAGTATADQELRAHAGSLLPSYAVPTVWSRIDELPLTPNGKVDGSRLPPPAARPRSQAAAAERPDSLQRRLLALWRCTLNLDAITLDDDFFDLGGHSLLAVELFDAIEREFGRRLPLSTLFETPTVRGLSAALREDGWQQSGGSLVAITPMGSRPPLFFVAAGDGNSVGFGALARRLGPEQPFFALQPRGINGRVPLQGSVERMAARYLRAIRRVQPHGPYLLGGRCLGALVAYELARMLERRGQRVALLAMLDSGGPHWRPRTLADGTRFDEVMSAALRGPDAQAANLVDVFSPDGTDRFLGWLAEPVIVGRDGTVINRYLWEAYRIRSHVRDAYPDLHGWDAIRLVDWAWRLGRAELGMTQALLPPPPVPEITPLKPPPFDRRDRVGDLRRWIAWRAREAADLLTAERRGGSTTRRRDRVLGAAERAWSAYRAGPYAGTITLIRSEEYRIHPRLDCWYALDTAGVVERRVRGTHRSMMREPDVADLARCLRELVDETANGVRQHR